jgi:hypothetical protein
MEGYMQQSQMAANVERIEKRKAEEPFRREESNPGHTRRWRCEVFLDVRVIL